MPTSSPDVSQLPLAPYVDAPPLIGSLLAIRGRPMDFLLDAAAKYGPAFRVWAPGIEVTVVHGEAGRELVRQSEELGLHRAGLFEAFASQIGLNIFGAGGAEHKLLRSLVRLGYSRHVAAEFAPTMARLVRERARAWPAGQTVKLYDTLGRIAVEQMAIAVGDHALGERADDFVRFISDVMRVTGRLSPKGIFLLPGYANARRRCQAALDETIARLAARPEPGPATMIEAFLRARGEGGAQMDAAAVRAACTYALAGSYAYHGPLITFLIYELLRNPTLGRLVQEEVDALYASGELDPALLRRCRHLRAAFHETLRMYILVPGLPFRASRDVAVAGYRVPAGEEILVTPVPPHFADEAFPNPTVFDAERCASPRSEHLKQPAFAPYGVTPRICAAPGMVELHVLTVVSAVLREVGLRLERPSYRPKFTLNPLLAPADGLPVVVAAHRGDLRAASAAVLQDREADLGDLWTTDAQAQAANTGAIESAAPGTVILRQGDEAKDYYVILTGRVVVTRDEAPGQVVATLAAGSGFGELGLLSRKPRNATVTAAEACTLLRIDADAFFRLVASSDLTGAELARLMHGRFVRTTLQAALPRLEPARLQQLVPGAEVQTCSAGEVVIRQGDPAEHLFVVASGRAEVIRVDEAGREHAVAALGPGEIFGEIGLLQRSRRTATVRATEPLVLLRVGGAGFAAQLEQSTAAHAEVAVQMGRRLLELIASGPPR
jgi:CRP-like cAMP-binding protein/cytochrome P450